MPYLLQQCPGYFIPASPSACLIGYLRTEWDIPFEFVWQLVVKVRLRKVISVMYLQPTFALLKIKLFIHVLRYLVI